MYWITALISLVLFQGCRTVQTCDPVKTIPIEQLCCVEPTPLCFRNAEFYGDSSEPYVAVTIDTAHPALRTWTSSGLLLRDEQVLVKVVFYVSHIDLDSTKSMIDSVQGASVYTYDTVSRLFTVRNYLVSHSVRSYQLVPDLTSELDWIGSKAYRYVVGYVLPYYGRSVSAVIDISVDLGDLEKTVFSDLSTSDSKQASYLERLQSFGNKEPHR